MPAAMMQATEKFAAQHVLISIGIVMEVGRLCATFGARLSDQLAFLDRGSNSVVGAASVAIGSIPGALRTPARIKLPLCAALDFAIVETVICCQA
ncbi:hypothetical protein [Mesorhizobium sp. B2-4-18]|uniref:hypothetical protein n=1 Tax=Mesorhizobium sp. B2-4-18 TaxID=2589931 RepID=UPI0015E3BA53|nr:hypothetical protein [Mesorhizobium sp. B2-4-18]